MELHLRRGVRVSAETVRRALHELGWVWKRAKLAAKDDDPQRVAKLARIRYTWEYLPAQAALFFADELDISLLPKVGYQWMPKGEQLEVLTPALIRNVILLGPWSCKAEPSSIGCGGGKPMACFWTCWRRWIELTRCRTSPASM